MQMAHNGREGKKKFVDETNKMVRVLLKCESRFEDCQFSVVWALTRALFLKEKLEGMNLSSKIVKRIGYILMVTRLRNLAGMVYKAENNSDVVEMRNRANLWNYKNSLLLRFSNTLSRYFSCILKDQKEESWDSSLLSELVIWRNQAEILIEKSVLMREEDKSLEFLTSFNSKETNSETQPWCTLGYYPGFDSYIMHAFLGKTCNVCRVTKKLNSNSNYLFLLTVFSFSLIIFHFFQKLMKKLKNKEKI